MKSKTTVFLILALLGCIAYATIWRDGFFLPPSGKPIADNISALLSEPPGKPVELTLTSQTGGQVKFRATAAGWKIVEPITAGAIDDKITSLIDTLVSITCLKRYEPTDSEAPDASVTGLDAPQWTVTLTDDKQKTYALQIGLHVPLSGAARTYVRLAGDKRICVIQGDLTDAMSRPVGYYRSPNILEIPADAISAVRVAGRETYSIVRNEQNQWIIKSGPTGKDQFPADKLATETFLARFSRIHARQFVDDNATDLAPYGLAPGTQRLRVTVAYIDTRIAKYTDKPITRSLSLGLKTGGAGREEVFAKLADHPAVFTLPASMLGELEPSTLKLRDKKILPIAADAVARLELTMESGSMTLAKTDNVWNIISPTSGRAHQERVELIIDRLTALTAMGFRSETASQIQFGLDRPRGSISLFKAGSDKPITLKIGADSPAGAVAFVQSSSADVVASVGASEIGVFLAPVACYYDPNLWLLPDKTDISTIALQRPDGLTELSGSAGGKWRMIKPLDAPVDVENVNAILDRLDSLTATRIVTIGEKTRAYYARGAGVISATFATRPHGAATSQPTSNPKTSTFNMAILNSKVYGWMTDDPLARVGLFSNQLYRQFAAEVRKRDIFDFDPESITEITLTFGPAITVLKKLDSGWKYIDDPDLQIDQAAIAKYIDQIKSIRATRFINHTGEGEFGLEKSKAWLGLELKTKDQKTISISVSRTGLNETANRYTSVSGLKGVIIISAEAAVGLVRKIGDFKK
jgi:hypothetical protein